MKEKAYDWEWMKENMKRKRTQDESRQARSPRSEEEWILKVVKR